MRTTAGYGGGELVKLVGARWKRRIWKATRRCKYVTVKESKEFTAGFLRREEIWSDLGFRRNLRNAMARERCLLEKEKQQAKK